MDKLTKNRGQSSFVFSPIFPIMGNQAIIQGLRQHYYHLVIISAITIYCFGNTYPTTAQISADNALPDGQSVVSPGTKPGLDFVITGGTQAGSNLFHSFAAFSVPTGGSAIFPNRNPNIQNIIGRVTGGLKSDINGLIQANSNLFLINPNGIVFGPNASLDISGSFIASTASSLKLSNGDVFSAVNPAPPLLTISIPLGLQFSNQPGGMKVEGPAVPTPIDSPLLLQPFQTLALVGGDISVADQLLIAPGGRIELGSVGENSFVSLVPSSQGFALGYAGVQKFQNLQLDRSLVDVSGPGGGNVYLQGETVTLNQTLVLAHTAPNATENGGGITIRGNQLSLNDSLVQTLTFGSATGGDVNLESVKVTVQGASAIVSAETEDIGKGGNLTIRADEVLLADLSILGTETKGVGAGGDVSIETRKLSLQDGAQVAVNTRDRGLGGKLTVKAADSINLVGVGELDQLYSSALVSETSSSGQAGEVIVETPKLSLRNGATISASTFADGAAGNIKIQAAETELISSPTVAMASGLFNQVEIGATGQGGNIILATDKLLIQGGSQVSTSTFGSGNAGSISVIAPQQVAIWGEATDQSFSGLFAQVEPGAIGMGGNVTVDTGQLFLQGEQARISASTSDVGGGGNVTINTRELTLRDGAQIQAATEGKAPGGIVKVTATETIRLLGTGTTSQFSSGLFTSTVGDAIAGNLNINTSNLFIEDGAEISASTSGAGLGGNISIHASDTVNLISTSGLFVQATGTGRAGNIHLTASNMLLDRGGKILAETAADDGGEISLKVSNILQLQNNSLISATAGNASKQGNGGNIKINTTFLVADPLGNSDITANAFAGRGGNIQITAQNVFGLELRAQQTPWSDITASSTFGVRGIVEIKTLDADPTKGLANLPTQITDSSNLIAQGCKADRGQIANQFVLTGKGGLSSSPESILSSDSLLADLDTNPIRSSQNIAGATSEPSLVPSSHAIVEAQAIVVNSQGEVLLLAQSPHATPYSTWSPSTNCYAD
ncbi:S-layer family protein [Tolypothrix sp. FACHB-123]|uniref:two-partner secretion domain-containing protein n=1 Tax=Tolypothrix sp. FACHB-123 TaxID=2692868 RepID=UPI001681F3E6|nr:S-layer family protein [Tolypothrix sp. FACHB-123]MBD2354842.1 S-layer family protein [Tolypothrix sp. FACHB-123]